MRQIDRLVAHHVVLPDLQTCIVHLIRNSLDYVGWKERKRLAAAIRPIYTAVSAGGDESIRKSFIKTD